MGAGQKTLPIRQRWGDLFNAVDLPAAFERDMRLWLRCHVPLCVAFEGVSVAAMRRCFLGGSGRSLRIVDVRGYLLYLTGQDIDRCPTWVTVTGLWSTLRDRSRCPASRS